MITWAELIDEKIRYIARLGALPNNKGKYMLKLYNELFNGYKITKKWEHYKGGHGNVLQADKWAEYRWCNILE